MVKETGEVGIGHFFPLFVDGCSLNIETWENRGRIKEFQTELVRQPPPFRPAGRRTKRSATEDEESTCVLFFSGEN